MNIIEKGQVSHSAAEVYEKFFVPALFQEWSSRVADAAALRPGHRVLDVACGTGVLARTAAEQVGLNGSVVGLDINDGMLAVAERQAPEITWRQGTAEMLPFDSDSFDAVVSQFGLMFFENKPAALKEMARVLRPGGRLAIAVWDTLQNTPGYAAMVNLLHRLFGQAAASGLEAPYILGDRHTLQELFERTGIPNVSIDTHSGKARFPSIQAWVHTDIKGWVLADMLNDAQFEQLLQEAERELQPFVTDQGTVSFPAPAHIVTFVKP